MPQAEAIAQNIWKTPPACTEEPNKAKEGDSPYVEVDHKAEEETIEGVIRSECTIRLLMLLLMVAVEASNSSCASKKKAEDVMLSGERKGSESTCNRRPRIKIRMTIVQKIIIFLFFFFNATKPMLMNKINLQAMS
jgi:hypothetical protein